MTFRLGFAVVGGLLGVCQAWMPSNHLVRWIYTDRGLRWGVPVAVVLVPMYLAVGHAAQRQIDAGGSAWWWLVLAWAVIGALKFLSIGVRTPFVWVLRTARRRASMRRGRREAA